MNTIASLLACTGQWSGTSTLQDPFTHKPVESASSLTATPILDGRFIRLDYTWIYDDRPQEGSLLVGYDPHTNMATAHWIDTWHMGHGVMALAGVRLETGGVDVRGTYAAPPGPDWGWRIILTPADESRLRLTMHNITPAGLEEPAVEAFYRREE